MSEEDDFVNKMLESAKKKFDKPQANNLDQDPKEIERLTEQLREKWQQR